MTDELALTNEIDRQFPGATVTAVPHLAGGTQLLIRFSNDRGASCVPEYNLAPPPSFGLVPIMGEVEIAPIKWEGEHYGLTGEPRRHLPLSGVALDVLRQIERGELDDTDYGS